MNRTRNRCVILVDMGPIVALVNDRDDHHQERKSLLERLPGPLLIVLFGL